MMIDVGTNNEKLLKDPLCKCFYVQKQEITKCVVPKIDREQIEV